LRLDDEVNVVALHRKMHDAKSRWVTLRCSRQRQPNRREHELTPEWRDPRAQRYVDRMARVLKRACAVRRAGS